MEGTKRIIPLSEELLQKIDGQRSDLEREEFINLCIDMALERDEQEGDNTEEEVVVLVPGGASSAATATPAALLRPGRRTRPRPATAVHAREEPGEEPLPLEWWIPALLLFGFGDTLTTALVLARGGTELNPIMRFALGLPGSLWSFVLFKTIVLASLLLIGRKANPTLRWVIPLLVTAVGSYLVWNNLFTFLRLS